MAASFVLSLFRRDIMLLGIRDIGAEVPTPCLLVSDVILMGLKLLFILDFLFTMDAPLRLMPIFLIFFFFRNCGISNS